VWKQLPYPTEFPISYRRGYGRNPAAGSGERAGKWMPISISSAAVRVFSSFQAFVIGRFIIGQQAGMKSMNQICQYYFGLHGHTFVEGFLAHIAIDYPFLAEGAEISITGV
jgi:hypothetical protein